MADSPAFPIDIQAAKNTKLFKKFMEGKNKSVVPAVTQVDLPTVTQIGLPFVRQEENQNTSNQTDRRISSQKFDQETVRANQYYEQPISYKEEIEPDQYWEKPSAKLDRYETAGRVQRNEETVMRTEKSQVPNVRMERKERRQIDDGDYKRKYERLMGEHEDLKEVISEERKHNKKETLRIQQELEVCKKKVFQLTSHEDELILQNRRLKEKTHSEVKDRQTLEEENRELQYQLQELKDMLEGQQRVAKRREDEAVHWRKQNEEMRAQIKDLQEENDKLHDLNLMLERQKMAAMKDTGNKQGYVGELREKINALISENSGLRDEIFQVTSRFYSLEQENTSLRADLRRHSDNFSQFSQSPSILTQPRVQAHRTHSTMEPHMQRRQEPQERKSDRRRGEFARQRGQRKIENLAEKSAPVVQNRRPPAQQNRGEAEAKMRRLDELNQELQKILDMRALNGNLRRQKIGIEREIGEIEEFFRSKNE